MKLAFKLMEDAGIPQDRAKPEGTVQHVLTVYPTNYKSKLLNFFGPLRLTYQHHMHVHAAHCLYNHSTTTTAIYILLLNMQRLSTKT